MMLAWDNVSLLAVLVAVRSVGIGKAREERIIAGFEDILRFHEAQKRAPQHGENSDIFERLYAVRLDQLRKLPEAHALLAELDKPGLLSEAPATLIDVNELDEDALLAELGVSSDPSDHADITVLRHVRPLAERQAAEPDDIETGTIYVLRSLSKHRFVFEHGMLIHKIGVTGGKVEARIADAENQATYLLAPVEIVAEYRLHNLNRTRMENIFHRLFSAVQLDLTIEDRFGKPVEPREWFVVPLHVIDEAVERFRDGSITELVYDRYTARLVNEARSFGRRL